jgi:hypothetical protein
MAIINFVGEGIVNWYGTNVLNECVKFGSSANAEQIVGLVPCKIEGVNCVTDCFTVPTFPGDFNSFLFEFTPSVVNADFRLFKLANDTFVQIAVLSAAEGLKFDLNSFSGHPNYAGYLIDWEKVFNLYGEGTYQFQVFDSVTPADSLKSYPFILKDDTCENKDGTIKLEVLNIGIYNNFNYTIDNAQTLKYDLFNIEWFDSCRYHGKVVPTTLTQEIEEIVFSNDRGEVYFNKGRQEYDVNIFAATYELYKRINHYALKGKNIKLTNDNLDRETEFTQKNILGTGESKSSKFPKNPLLYQITIVVKDEFGDNYRVCE